MWKSVVAVLVLLVPSVSFAAGLVPCGGVGEDPCQLCHVGELLSLIGNWLSIVLGIVVVLIIIVAGMRMVVAAGDLSAVTSARRLISSAVIGYILFLAAWLLVDTGLRFLLNQPAGVWNTIQCVVQPVAQAYSRPTASGDSAATLPPSAVEDRVESINSSGSLQADIAAAAAAAGITDPEQVNILRALISQESSNCTNVVGPTTNSGVAYGCGQILVSTARTLDPGLASLSDAQVAERLRDNDQYNLTLSARYFNQLLSRYRGEPNQTDLALAAYNGGPGANRPSQDCPGQRAWQCVWDSPGCYNTSRTDCRRNEGPNSYAQTRHYVANINAIAAGL